MAESDQDPSDDQFVNALHVSELRLSDFLWRPCYAKLWWAMIPVYWLAMGEPTRPKFLNAFAESGYAVFTNIIFIPITALAVLGSRFLRRAAEIGRLEASPMPPNKIFGRPSDYDSWNSQLNPQHIRNSSIRGQVKF